MRAAAKLGDPWDDVRILLAVLRAGTFRSAARALKLEQSTVSRRIARLERALGGELFDRKATGPAPTALALRMRPFAERMAAQWLTLQEQSQRSARGPAGRVRLAVPSSFAVHIILPFVLPRLRAKYPLLALDLIVDERAANLGEREAEIAVRFFRPAEPSLVVKRVTTLSTAVLASRAYAATRAAQTHALDWVMLELGDGRLLCGDVLGTGLEPVMRTTTHLTQIEAVRAGVGVAILPRALTHLMPDLVEVVVAEIILPRTEVWLAAPASLVRTARIRAVWEALTETLCEVESGRLLLVSAAR